MLDNTFRKEDFFVRESKHMQIENAGKGYNFLYLLIKGDRIEKTNVYRSFLLCLDIRLTMLSMTTKYYGSIINLC